MFVVSLKQLNLPLNNELAERESKINASYLFPQQTQ